MTPAAVGTPAVVETAARTVAGRYRLHSRLGSGGMGTVWRAEDTVLGREVAVKEVTFPHGISDEERDVLRERTRREARAAARLDHPSAVTVYDVVEEDGTPYLVMELVEARTLADLVRSDGPLTPASTAEVGLAVLGALEAAHAQGIVHRDVKPGNVLVRPDGRVVLTDFGIATTTGDASITSTGLLLGSPSYMAPERLRGDPPGPPSDLWSLGATLFTAVEGRPPYDAGGPLPTLTAVLTEDHAPYAAAGPLAPVLDGLLDKDPARRTRADAARAELDGVRSAGTTTAVLTVASRHAPAEAVAEPASLGDRTAVVDLAALGAAPATPSRPAALSVPRVLPTASPGRRRRPALLLAAALVTVALAGLITVLLTGSRKGPPAASAPSGAAPAASSAPATGGSVRSPAPTQSPAAATPVTGAVPAGWVLHRGDSGAVAVPAFYAAGTFDGFPQFKDPSSGRTLQLSATAPGGGKPDAVADRRAQARSFSATHPSYREIAITPASYRGYEAADWEFTYRAGGTDLHVLNRVFVVNGRGYSLFFQTRASDDWTAARAQFLQIAATFAA